MIDIKVLRSSPEEIKKRLCLRVSPEVIDGVLGCDERRRAHLKKVEELRFAQKKVSGEDARQIKEERKKLEEELKNLEKEFFEKISALPNIPAEEVSDRDVVVRSWGSPAENLTPHWEIGKKLDILDFETASSITQSFWPLLRDDGALLEFALINFFIEENLKAGFRLFNVPYLVNRDSVFGTGQLPKFEDELYKVEKDGLYLIPTGEVPAGNLFRNKILAESELPVKIQVFSPCFRREAGSWGKKGRGLIRNHQFHKVEIFEYVAPENSSQALEEMTAHSASLLEKLGLPYRVVLLSASEMGFSACKTYDIEVGSAEGFLEVASCSNCGDFQTRRTNTKYRKKTGEVGFLHSLNASSLAAGRTLAAILENYWDERGFLRLPECLKKFVGKDKIEKV